MSIEDEALVAASPFPIVSRDNLSVPLPGIAIETPAICRRVYPKGQCEAFYRNLQGNGHDPVQCPYGLASWTFSDGASRFAVTGLIPFPRLGGDEERARAREFPENRIASEKVAKWISSARSRSERFRRRLSAELSNRLRALHEVRRLNQVIKTLTERACSEASPANPDQAPGDRVRAWKASELISVHLDALELLASIETPTVVKKSPAVFFKIVDKMTRIYSMDASSRNVRLQLGGNSESLCAVDVRTIHIVPSVLIDNAVKYSRGGGVVKVTVSEGYKENHRTVVLQVESEGPVSSEAEERVLFLQSGRGASAKMMAEGSGFGLVLARRVADLNDATLGVAQHRISADRSKWNFRFEIAVFEPT